MGSVAHAPWMLWLQGGLEVRGEKGANLVSNSSITAYSSTAPVDLERGGEVLVCSTSQFHLLRSGAGESLSFGLDRGAIEIRSPSQPQDVIPDAQDSALYAGDAGQARSPASASRATVIPSRWTTPVPRLPRCRSPMCSPVPATVLPQGSMCCSSTETCTRWLTARPPPAAVRRRSRLHRPRLEALRLWRLHRTRFPQPVSQGLRTGGCPGELRDDLGQEHVQVADTLAYGASQPDTFCSAQTCGERRCRLQVCVQRASALPAGSGTRSSCAVGRFFHKLFHPKS